MPVEELIAKLGERHCDGSSMSPGVSYQDIPGFAFPFHRGRSEWRASRITELVDVKGKIVYDLGCSVGSITGQLGFAGAASVTGFDHDDAALDVARSLYNSNTSFEHKDLTLEFLDTFQQVDVVVWTSQFMWMVKQHGMEYALDFLWKLSTKAEVLVFESGGRDDGSAPLKMRQEDFMKMLCRNTVYQEITDHGPWNDGWTPRNVFVCRRPFRDHEGEWSKVEAVSRGVVKKTFKDSPYAKELLKREIDALHRIGPGWVPEVFSSDQSSITMEWCGPRATWIPEWAASGILTLLFNKQMVHRDIRPDNLLWNGKNVVLIDFSFATIGDEITNYHYDLGGKYKCPQGFNDEYSLKKIQQELLCK